jgi:predicted Fe-Mo cluster-binding NifX family protein
VENQALNEAHGAGLAAAQSLVDRNVDVVVTGRCGPKASSLLMAAGIEVYERYEGAVADAPMAVKSGKLEKRVMFDNRFSHHGGTKCE